MTLYAHARSLISLPLLLCLTEFQSSIYSNGTLALTSQIGSRAKLSIMQIVENGSNRSEFVAIYETLNGNLLVFKMNLQSIQAE